jgi:hypothetical protein
VLSEAQLDRPRLVTYYRDAWAGMKSEVARLEAERRWPRGDHASWYEAFPFTRVSSITSRTKAFPQTPDFPPFPLNPRSAREYLADGTLSGDAGPMPDDVMERLLQACVDDVSQLLRGLPRTPPTT